VVIGRLHERLTIEPVVFQTSAPNEARLLAYIADISLKSRQGFFDRPHLAGIREGASCALVIAEKDWNVSMSEMVALPLAVGSSMIETTGDASSESKVHIPCHCT